MKRFCTECGQLLDKGYKFCPHCGAAAKGVAEPQGATPVKEKPARKPKKASSKSEPPPSASGNPFWLFLLLIAVLVFLAGLSGF